LAIVDRAAARWQSLLYGNWLQSLAGQELPLDLPPDLLDNGHSCNRYR
jgi:hypothetical protein